MDFLSVGSVSRVSPGSFDVAFMFCFSDLRTSRPRIDSLLQWVRPAATFPLPLSSSYPGAARVHFRARRPPTEGHGEPVLHGHGRRGPVRGPLSGGAGRDRTRSPSYLCYFIHFSLFLSGSIHPTPVDLPPWASCSSSRSGWDAPLLAVAAG